MSRFKLPYQNQYNIQAHMHIDRVQHHTWTDSSMKHLITGDTGEGQNYNAAEINYQIIKCIWMMKIEKLSCITKSILIIINMNFKAIAFRKDLKRA